MKRKHPHDPLFAEDGVSLLETLVALVVLTIGIGGVLGLFGLAMRDDENHGNRAARIVECAQDKMEQLVALAYTDGTSDTTGYPTQPTGGTGLGGVMAGNATVGGVNPSSPVTHYVDYLDERGAQLPSSTGAMYARQWMISTNSTATMKTITVLARAVQLIGGAAAPSTRLVTRKTATR